MARWRARVFPSGVRLQQFEKNHQKVIWRVGFLISIALNIYILYVAHHEGQLDNAYREGLAGILNILLVFFALFVFFLFGYGSVLFGINIILPFLLLVAALLAFVIDAVLVEPTAWVISHPKNENLIKGVSIIVFLIGFYFDLLAS